MEATMINQRKPNPFVHAIRAKYFSPALVYAACSAGLLVSAPISAQETEVADEETTEIIEVKGIRGTIQSSISIKRESTEIVDGISADDIGDLPHYQSVRR